MSAHDFERRIPLQTLQNNICIDNKIYQSDAVTVAFTSNILHTDVFSPIVCVRVRVAVFCFKVTPLELAILLNSVYHIEDILSLKLKSC